MRKSILTYILLLSTTVLLSNKVLAQEESTQRTILVINAVVDEEHKSELKGYLSQMMQIFKENDGTPLGRYKTIEKITGSRAPEMIAMISFENAETIKSMLDGDKYKSLSELRERVFSDLKIVICTELN